MAINVLRAAKHLCMMSDWTLTNLELQKVLYLANMNYLGEHKKSLIQGNFEAWKFGPVHPKLYHQVKQFCANFIAESAFTKIKDLDPKQHQQEIKILEDFHEIFPSGSANALIEITHWEGGAWKKIYVPSKNNVIAQKHILEEYKRIEQEDPWGE